MLIVPIASLFFPLRKLFPFKKILSYERLIGTTVLDALFYLPHGVITWEAISELLPFFDKHFIVFKAKIISYKNNFSRVSQKKTTFTVTAEFIPLEREKNRFSPQKINLTFFYGNMNYIKKLFPLGRIAFLKGQLSFSQQRKEYSIVHPFCIESLEDNQQIQKEPLYSSNSYVNPDTIRRLIREALKRAPSLPEWIPEELKKKNQWPTWKEALERVHSPQKLEDTTLYNHAKQRLVFDELLAKQIALEWKSSQQLCYAPLISVEKSFSDWIQSLPFPLTPSQYKAIHDIQKDLNSSKPMLRLLQGDVGSGKTIVALAAALQVIQSGFQVAFLAPTDVLAHQHFSSILKYLGQYNINITLYTSQQIGKKRRQILDELRSGKINFLVGTHALIQNCVEFSKLGLAIIDEQHRFGVEQRLQFSEKTKNNKGIHTLSLSATPIPRTLLLSHYGNVSISILTDKPVNRQNIKTCMISLEHVEEIEKSLQRILQKNQQVYWVCPLVKNSESLNLMTVERRFKSLSAFFPKKVALLHGQMKAEEKQKVMHGFYDGRISILVATTVIEIGVDAPHATVMIIEHAERFGLSQLHQLRGRVGRGSQLSSCILLYAPELTDIAKNRLSIIRNCSDGFKIAELDMLMRGSGDIFGTQQSGKMRLRLLPKLNITSSQKNPSEMDIYINLLTEATHLARTIISQINTPKLQLLLKLFGEELKEENLKAAC